MSYLELLRKEIVNLYRTCPTDCGSSFGELLCYELHIANKTFIELANFWGISLPTLGELIKDHCDRLQPVPKLKKIKKCHLKKETI